MNALIEVSKKWRWMSVESELDASPELSLKSPLVNVFQLCHRCFFPEIRDMSLELEMNSIAQIIKSRKNFMRNIWEHCTLRNSKGETCEIRSFYLGEKKIRVIKSTILFKMRILSSFTLVQTPMTFFLLWYTKQMLDIMIVLVTIHLHCIFCLQWKWMVTEIVILLNCLLCVLCKKESHPG